MNRFRCPYCGEQAFSTLIKMGIHSKLRTAPQCPHCKKIAYRVLGQGGWIKCNLVILAISFLSACVFALFIWLKNVALLIAGILLFVALYLGYHYFLCHYDVASKDKKKFPIREVEQKGTNKLWPNIRQGEIYLLIPMQVSNPSVWEYQTIALLDRIEADTLHFRIIRASEPTPIGANCGIKIVSDNGFSTEGVVL